MNKTYFSFLKHYILKQKISYILIFIILLIQSVIMVVIPFIEKILLDEIFPNKQLHLFLFLVSCLIIGYIIYASLNIFKDYLLSKISENIARSLRLELQHKISVLEHSFFDNYNYSDILSRYNKEIQIIQENFGDRLIRVLNSSILLIITLLIIGYFSTTILVITIIMMIFYIINNKYFGKKIKDLAERSMKFNEESIGYITQTYQNNIIIKLYNAYKYVEEKFNQIYQKQYRNSIKLEVYYSINITTSMLLYYCLLGVIWIIGGIGVIENKFTIGTITSLISYQGMLLSPMSFFSQFNNDFQETKVAIERLIYILHYKEEESGSLFLEERVQDIRFEEINFTYPNREQILENVNMTFKKGETTVLAGLSGSGKTTLVKMLLRLVKPTKGFIYINNIQIEKINLQLLREKITLVGQESLFFEDTIWNNLKIAGIWSEKRLIELCGAIDILEEILRMPQKWNTILSENTKNLSEGQKKRLDIIRALLKDSDVLIFDESSASLDIARRNKLHQILELIKREKIIIIISHNTEEFKYYDRIYYLKDKKVNQGNVFDNYYSNYE